MRDIRYRAWDGKKLFRVTMLYLTKNGVKVGGGGHLQVDAKRVKLMQFTGLFDGKRHPIFEGDVIAYGDGNAVVEWHTDHLNAGYVINRQPHTPMPLGIPHKSVMEVVGNIYENPELLKGIA